jgi:hypothetical protein
MWRRAALVVTTLAGCGLEVDYGGTQFQCEQACPEGQECVAGVCRSGPIDAGSSDAPADGMTVEPGSYAEAVLTDEPILYLRFEEGDGDTAIDWSGAGRDGTYETGTTFDSAGAFAGSSAVHVDGVSGRVTVPDDEALRLNGDWTIELWIKLDEVVNEFPGVVHKGNADEAGSGYIMYYTDGALLPTLKRAGNDGIAPNGEPLSTVGYRHFVLTYDQSEFTAVWYVDGGEVNMRTDETWGENVNMTQLSFGRGDDFGKHWIDEVAMYDRALTADRVAAHFAAAEAAGN